MATETTSAVKTAETTVENDVKAEVTKAEAWLKKFWYQALIGAAIYAVLQHFVHFLRF